jgi:hypothetical protein
MSRRFDCSTCEFFRVIEDPTDGYKRQECRINPPAAGRGFPRVDETDWCGRFSERPEARPFLCGFCSDQKRHAHIHHHDKLLEKLYY